MFGLLLLLHVLGATVWTGGHIILATIILPKALQLQSPETLLAFEEKFERIGMPALLIQIATGLMLVHRLQPNITLWFDMSNPWSHPVMAKLSLLALTLGFALHSRFRVIPTLSAGTLKIMAWHIVPVTIFAVLFVVVGVSLRTGWLF